MYPSSPTLIFMHRYPISERHWVLESVPFLTIFVMWEAYRLHYSASVNKALSTRGFLPLAKLVKITWTHIWRVWGMFIDLAFTSSLVTTRSALWQRILLYCIANSQMPNASWSPGRHSFAVLPWVSLRGLNTQYFTKNDENIKFLTFCLEWI